jgi:hypothetical protein
MHETSGPLGGRHGAVQFALMYRRLFNIASALSLLLCATAAVTEVVSYGWGGSSVPTTSIPYKRFEFPIAFPSR